MGIIFGTVVMIIILALLMVYRNDNVYIIRTEARIRVKNWTNKLFDNANSNEKLARWRDFYTILDQYPSYDDMLLDFRSWTYDDYYGDLDSRLEKAYNEIMTVTN